MILGSQFIGSRFNPKVLYVIFGLGYLIIALIELAGYIPWTSVNFIIGMIGLPFTMQNNNNEPRLFKRFYWIALIFGLLSFLMPLKTVLFIAMVAAILSIAEEIRGKLSVLSILTLALMSPTVQYLAGIFSFPIRLALTRLAGQLLNFTGKATTAGNVITYGGSDYSVDPACMGLKMLLTSLLCGIFIIAIYQKKQQKYLNGLWVLGTLSFVFILNIVSNMIRILVLVFFDIKPNNNMHELTGLACLIIYVLLPAIWFIQKALKWKGKSLVQKEVINTIDIQPTKLTFLHCSLILLLLCSCVTVNRNSGSAGVSELPQIAGYRASVYDSDVLQYKNKNALIYIKKINGVFCSEHNPVMCWLGSGYIFESINEENISGTTIYTGTLQKGKDVLYTAWWYDNGTDKTLGQWAWRWKALKGQKQYSVINVTSASKSDLVDEVNKINRQNIFKAAL